MRHRPSSSTRLQRLLIQNYPEAMPLPVFGPSNHPDSAHQPYYYYYYFDSEFSIMSDSSQPSAAAPTGVTLSDDQFKQLLAATQTAPRKTLIFKAPRIGGTNSTGVWTGLGSNSLALLPREGFDADALNHVNVASIKVKC